MGKILVWALRMISGALIFAASVGPDSVKSNTSEWLNLAGFEDLPAFISKQTIDQPIALVALSVFFLTLAPWKSMAAMARGRLSRSSAGVTPVAPAPSPPSAAFELRAQPQERKVDSDRHAAAENGELAKRIDAAITFFQTPTRPGVLPNRVTTKGPNHLIINGLHTLGISPEREGEKMRAKREEIERNALYCVLSDSDKAIWASEKDKQAYHIQIAQMEGLRELLKEAGFL